MNLEDIECLAEQCVLGIFAEQAEEGGGCSSIDSYASLDIYGSAPRSGRGCGSTDSLGC